MTAAEVSGGARTTLIKLDGVTLKLGRRTILRDVSLSIADNEFVGVLGSNGAGKTTLMRAILGLIPIEAGSISVFGGETRSGNAAIGYMPQSRSSLSSLPLRGYDFVAGVVNGQWLGLPILSKAGRRDVDWALDQVGASELARRPLFETSGGERQRLLLAQALVGRPKLLLLDEPLMSLDPSHQASVVALVKTLCRELKLTVLFSSHELNPLLDVLDRVLYLGRGQAALGTVDEVITTPVLSKLYGAPIEVIRLGGRIFVMSGKHELERDDHRHEGDHGHLHGYGHDHGPASQDHANV